MSLPNYIPFAQRSAVGKRWAKSKSSKRIASGVDDETLKRRALHDARGEVIRAGCTYSNGREVSRQIRRSVLGRTNQFDAMADGAVIRTGGMRKVQPIFQQL